MLREGRRRLVDEGIAGNVSIAQVDAENLPFAESSFDCITIAFGLRNVTDKQGALESMRSVLKPGGKAMILEFSKPVDAIKPAYDLYSFRVLPLLGKLVAKDPDELFPGLGNRLEAPLISETVEVPEAEPSKR